MWPRLALGFTRNSPSRTTLSFTRIQNPEPQPKTCMYLLESPPASSMITQAGKRPSSLKCANSSPQTQQPEFGMSRRQGILKLTCRNHCLGSMILASFCERDSQYSYWEPLTATQTNQKYAASIRMGSTAVTQKKSYTNILTPQNEHIHRLST